MKGSEEEGQSRARRVAALDLDTAARSQDVRNGSGSSMSSLGVGDVGDEDG